MMTLGRGIVWSVQNAGGVLSSVKHTNPMISDEAGVGV